MVGGGNRRDEGSMPIQNTNLFAALDNLRKKKKKSDKAGKSKGSSKSSSRQDPQKEPEPQVFWAPTPLKAKAWADIDSDDEDDDYYATTAPPQSVWSTSEAIVTVESHDDDYDEDDEAKIANASAHHEHIKGVLKQGLLRKQEKKQKQQQRVRKRMRRKITEKCLMEMYLLETSVNKLLVYSSINFKKKPH